MPKPAEFKVARSSPPGKVTPAQCDFLAVLFNECGYNLSQRAGMLANRLGRQCQYLDELTIAEASSLIDELCVCREERR